MTTSEPESKGPTLHRVEEIVPAHWSEGTITANGIRQHFYRTGGEKPVIVLLHGFSENGLCWSRVAKALEDGYDLILLDARGHGRSDGPETGYSQELLTADVIAFIGALGLERPFLWGFSTGALTAADVAATAPDLARAVILEDPPWGDAPSRPAPQANSDAEPWPAYHQWLATWIAWHVALRGQTFAERIASSGSFLPPGALNWPEEELLTHLEAQAEFNLAVLDLTPPVPGRSPRSASVERIACPVLLLTSDPARGGMVTLAMAAQIVATWRSGEYVSFPGASHFLHHEMQGEEFERFVAIVRAFLVRQE
jgi:N-formylmaleamate deformylase